MAWRLRKLIMMLEVAMTFISRQMAAVLHCNPLDGAQPFRSAAHSAIGAHLILLGHTGFLTHIILTHTQALIQRKRNPSSVFGAIEGQLQLSIQKP